MNFFSKYGFEREPGFVSKVETSGFVYSNTNSPFVNDNKGLNALYVDKFDMEVPLCAPIMEGYYKEVLDFNGDVILTSNYNPEMPVIISNSVSKVNLNGKKVIAPVFTEKNGGVFKGFTDSYAFWVTEGGDLTIEGDGEVIASEAEYSMAVWSNGGKVTIKGGKFYNNGNNSDLIYASNGGTVEIYGGEFHANENKGAAGTKNRFPALNIKDKDRETTKIVVYGGKFFGFNPADNVSEGDNTNFVADGYTSVEVSPNVWEVVAI